MIVTDDFVIIRRIAKHQEPDGFNAEVASRDGLPSAPLRKLGYLGGGAFGSVALCSSGPLLYATGRASSEENQGVIWLTIAMLET